MRQTYEVMGTVATLDIPDCDNGSAFNKAFKRLEEIDGRYSTYKPGSEVNRYRRGGLDHPSSELKRVKAACERFERLTSGYFSANFAGSFDPTGYVKGWAIAEAAKVIEKEGFKTFCLGIGGDILAASDTDKTWGIGIQDPQDKMKIIKELQIKNGAVATSGAYERGGHIINPKTGRPVNYWASVTVTGPDIITADVLATACFAAGGDAQKIMSKFKAYEIWCVKS